MKSHEEMGSADEKRFYMRLMTVNNAFANEERIEEAFQEITHAVGSRIVACLDLRDRMRPVRPGSSILKYLHTRRNEGGWMAGIFDTSSSETLDFHVRWTTSEFFDAARQISPNISRRAEFGFQASGTYGWSRCEQLFLTTVESISPHWGELNDEGFIGRPTTCTLDGHYLAVPNLGSANYFEDRYCDFLGGRNVFHDVGFHGVRRVHNGVYVTLPPVNDEAEYLDVRQRLQSRIGPPGIFDSDADNAMPPFAEWGENQ